MKKVAAHPSNMSVATTSEHKSSVRDMGQLYKSEIAAKMKKMSLLQQKFQKALKEDIQRKVQRQMRIVNLIMRAKGKFLRLLKRRKERIRSALSALSPLSKRKV